MKDKESGAAVMQAASEKPQGEKEAPAAEKPREEALEKTPAKPTVKPVKPSRMPVEGKRTALYTAIVQLYRLIAKLFFFMRFEGLEHMPKENCVLMGNHQCLLDPVTLALCARDREICFMGKKELFDIPVLGAAFREVHGFPVDRGNMDMGAIRTAMNVLKEGHTMGIFPEGTRAKDGPMLPLLGGAFMLAVKSGRPVVPIYIDGNYRLFRRITVRVGETIDTQEIMKAHKGRAAMDALQAQVEDSFAQLSGGKSRAQA